VLTNTFLREDIVLYDEELLLEGIAFKKWFFRSCFSHPYYDEVLGRPVWPGVDLTITLLKRLGAWITYYGAFSSETERPRAIDPLPGSDPSGNQTLTWYGGALKHLRKPWLLKPDKVTIHALCGMAGFGRALPPASAAVAHKAGWETFGKLTTEIRTDPNWLRAFSIAARRVAKGMKKIPTRTHCSINASACYERTTEEGGTASYVVAGVNSLLKLRIDLLFEDILEVPNVFYDMFGRTAIGPFLHWLVWRRRKAALAGRPIRVNENPIMDISGDSRPVMFGMIAYRDTWMNPAVNNGQPYRLANGDYRLPNLFHGGSFRYNREIAEIYGTEDACFVNETLGDITALWAAGESLAYGNFVELDGTPAIPSIPGFALFKTPGPKIWVQHTRVPAKFMVLEEPGWKARPLTKNLAWVTVLQSLLRHPLAESLGSNGRCGFGLKSSYIFWDFLKFLKKKKLGKGAYWCSTDLSASTDHIPHDLLRVMWKATLPSIGLKKTHPLYGLINMIMLDHTLLWGFKDDLGNARHAKEEHLCGSFMGEPVSFMGLTLYNLCVDEVSNFVRFKVGSSIEDFRWDTHLLREFSSGGPWPGGYVVITGDDMTEKTDLPGKFPVVNHVYRMTNGRPSAGKNTVSPYHGIHAENHVITIDGYDVYLDIIKPKLLTPSTRFHSDNQSSILGKGTQLFLQLDWLTESKFFDSQFVASCARCVYVDMFSRGFYPSDVRIAKSLPIGLPPSLGGISFPVGIRELESSFRPHMSFVWWLLERASIQEFLNHALRLMDITSSAKRGLPVDFTGSLWETVLSDKIERDNLNVVKDFDPTDGTKLYPLWSVLEFIKKEGVVPLSPHTGMPQVNLAARYAMDTWGFFPLESIVDLIARQSTFFNAFTKGVQPVAKLSFHRYLTKLRSFWDKTLVSQSHIDMTGYQPYKDTSSIHWKFQQKFKTFIHIDAICDGALTSGPGLFLDLSRKRGPRQTTKGNKELLLSTIWAYLSRIAEDDRETTIYRPEWASAHDGMKTTK
jgi:hypothetical protein